MNVSRTRKFVSQMGNYGEKYEASVTVTMNHQDLGYTDEEWRELAADADDGGESGFEELHDAVMSALNPTLEEEIAEANRLRDPDEDSFLNPLDQPRRTTRRKN